MSLGDWDMLCQHAVADIKQALTHPPCLAFPDFDVPNEVHTDASLAGVEAVLYQNGRTIAFESRRLTAA
jgi:RNase H-like domain found in reverse transcriptase